MCLPAFMTSKSVTSVIMVMIFLNLLMLIEIPRNFIEIVWGTSSYVWTTAYLPPSSVPYYAVLSNGQQSGTAQYGWAYFMIALNPLRGVLFILTISLALVAKERAMPTRAAAAFMFIYGGFALFQIGYYGFFGWLDPFANFISRTRDLTVVCNAQSCPYSLQFQIVFYTTVIYFFECFFGFAGLLVLRPSMQKLMIAMGDDGIKPISSLATTSNGHIVYKIDHHKSHGLSDYTVKAILNRLKRHTQKLKAKNESMGNENPINNKFNGNNGAINKIYIPTTFPESISAGIMMEEDDDDEDAHHGGDDALHKEYEHKINKLKRIFGEDDLIDDEETDENTQNDENGWRKIKRSMGKDNEEIEEDEEENDEENNDEENKEINNNERL